MTVIPAYGRDYKSKKEVMADWNADKDFQIVSIHQNCGSYINKSQAPKDEYISIRYKRLSEVVVVKTK